MENFEIKFKHEGAIDTLVIAVSKDLVFDAPHLPKSIAPLINHVLEDRKNVFNGNAGESFLIVLEPSAELSRVLLIGTCFKEDVQDIEKFTTLGGHVGQALKKNKITMATIGWHSFKAACAIDDSDSLNYAAHFAQGCTMANYCFNKYLTSKRAGNFDIAGISFVDTDDMPKETHKSIVHINGSIGLTRDVINEPPNVLNPASFAKIAEELSDYGVKVKVIKGAELAKLNMGCLAAVGNAGSEPPRLLLLEWKGSKSTKFDYAFIGKGVTFDTGGLCIKPPGHMHEMKSDMGGGGAILGALRALALCKAPCNVIGAIPLAENMISEDAYRPSDILESYSKKTVEVIDTDAEGRLILADALSYVSEKYKPDLMVDLATLTGAVIVALGNKFAALFANDDVVLEKLHGLGGRIGEKLWKMPLSPAYEKGMESHVADIRNISVGYGAGCITAAKFLQEFIPEGQKWAHIDIAGVAYRSQESPLYQTRSATGFGVRLLVGLVLGEDYI